MKALSDEISSLCVKEVGNSKLHKKIAKELLVENGIPMDITSDILMLKRDPSTESRFVQYHILRKLNEGAIPTYFSEDVIAYCKSNQYQSLKAKLPLEFDVIQIADNQWIGKISVKELMTLSDSGLINYNENAQRVLKRVTIAGEETYKISINKRAVASIKNSLEAGRYIPNTITLNIPYTDESEFRYSDKTRKITIKQIKAFDILDGYHRYVAISSICAMDNTFDYTMELRLTNFTDEVARQFIWQEDQKTKMSRVDSDSFNKYDIGNQIVNRIKSNNIYGSIISSKGVINDAVLSNAIRKTYKLRSDKNYKVSEITRISNEIIKGLNALVEQNETIFDTKLENEQITEMIKRIHDGKVVTENV